MKREWLINARIRKKLTQEHIADQVGCTRQYYGMIESSERNPSVPLAKKIGDVLDLEWTLFFDSKGNKTCHYSERAV